MATKTTKKSTAKPVTAKKSAVKKTAATKTTRTAAAKATKNTKKLDMNTSYAYADAGMAQEHNCHCGQDCHCGKDCRCGKNCECGANCKCHRRGFGHFVKKLIIALILLALGFAAAKICCCDKGMRGPHVQFGPDGCMIEESVKCPKLLEVLPAMDINQDGCITREEYREIKRQLHQRAHDDFDTPDFDED